MSFETFQALNTFIPLAAFGWLAYRIGKAWPADWARPDHQWHYRVLLLLIALYVLLSSVVAIVHECNSPAATVVSALYTLQSVMVLGLCHWWPKGKGR